MNSQLYSAPDCCLIVPMKHTHLWLKTLLVVGATSFLTTQAQNVQLTITNLKSTDGQILVAVFKDQQGFKEEKPVSRHRFPKSSLTNGTLKVLLDLPPGTYGLALVDDTNKNGKMDKNMLGIPKEGVAFSNFYLSGMSKPTFNDFKFEVKGASVSLDCKMRNF